MSSRRTLGSKDWEERVVKKPVGRARFKLVTKLELAKSRRDGDLESPRETVREAKARAKKYEYDVRAERAKKELENIRGGVGQRAFVVYPEVEGGYLLIQKKSLNPGEVQTIGKVRLEGKKNEKKEGREAEAVSLVKETTDAVRAGIAVGKEAAGGGKGMSSDEVRKIMEDKLETYTTKMDAKFDKVLAKIDKVIEGGGTKKDVVDTIKDLQDLGVIAKKREGEKGEGGVSGLSKTIKELEDAGLVVRATKVNQEAAKLEFEKEKEGMSFWLAAKKLVLEEKKAIMEERTKARKIDMFKSFTKDIGKAVAEALEEEEEEAEEGEEEEGAGEKGKRERVIEESEKTPAGIEIFTCDAVIDGVKCGAKVSIPPEAQKEGYHLVCPKCGSTFEYLPPEEKTK